MSKRLNITVKMLGSFVILLTLMAAIGIFSVVKIGAVNDLSAEMRSRWLPATQMIGNLHAYTSQYRIQQNMLVTATTDQERKKAKKMLRNGDDAVSSAIAEYGTLIVSSEQKNIFKSLQTSWDSYSNLSDNMVSLSENGDPAALILYNGEAVDMFYAVEDNLLQLIDLNVNGAEALSAKSALIYIESRQMVINSAILGCVIAGFLALLMMKTFVKPITQMSTSIKRLVDGDLEVELHGLARADELGSLARALNSFKALFAAEQGRSRSDLEKARETEETIKAIGNGLAVLAQGDLTHNVREDVTGPLSRLHLDYNDAVAHLRDVLKEIVEGFSIIRDGTDEIANASADLSQRTEQQAESLGHASQTLAEFSESVRVAAGNALQTSSRLAVARASAEKVDETAKRAVRAMRNIESSSKEMNDIITTIDGLAFQTNLLALNAGVEAARAGSSGAGFAVVANEVRNLARRSAEAANSIRQLVTTSDGLINEGVSLVENSGEALQRIVTEVTEVSDLVDQIAKATERQAGGISEISNMVGSMDRATQQNAAMVEQSTSSSLNLSNETQRLFELLAFFDLGHDQETSGIYSDGNRKAA